jgi:hypothetical protein
MEVFTSFPLTQNFRRFSTLPPHHCHKFNKQYVLATRRPDAVICQAFPLVLFIIRKVNVSHRLDAGVLSPSDPAMLYCTATAAYTVITRLSAALMLHSDQLCCLKHCSVRTERTSSGDINSIMQAIEVGGMIWLQGG